MEKPPITFTINGKTFRVRADALEALRLIPAAERQQLIELLEAIRRQEPEPGAAVARPVAGAAPAAASAPVAVAAALPAAVMKNTAPAPATGVVLPAATASPPVEKPGKGDVDDLMKRLIMEERSKQKPLPQAKTVYLWMGVFFVAATLLMLLL